MAGYLTTYKPLITTKKGREAIEKFDLYPFLDGSCRREPDFEPPRPSISALCRGKNFAPRLNRGDEVVYLARKWHYGNLGKTHWRLVAHLKVIEPFGNHAEAADWYRTNGYSVPKNCMVSGAEPLPLSQTGGAPDSWDLNKWNENYWERSQKCGVFLACEALYLNLTNPPVVTEEMMIEALGRVRGTQNPPMIEVADIEKLLSLATKRQV